ncbi:hypothetical protein [Streptomyces misionensis]
MVTCPSPKCGSPNVADLPHYWRSLPAESPLKAVYAPPAAVEARYWVALAAVVAGIVLLVSGSLLGLVVAAAGVGWGVLVYRRAAAAGELRADWESSRVCLACTGMF